MLRPPRRRERVTIDIFGVADFGRIPSGYFLCEAGGKTNLGHLGPLGLSWDVRTTLTEKELEVLPVVRLRLVPSVAGLARIGGSALLDSRALDGFSGDFEWDEAL